MIARLLRPLTLTGVLLFACQAWLGADTPATPAPSAPVLKWDSPGAGNPLLPGYFADPSLLQDKSAFYIYATVDPWGADTLGCWKSTNFIDWTFIPLNWPTKSACTSQTSKSAMVWAPSVVQGGDGRYHMLVSVGSEVWAGVADNPEGPWQNAVADNQPLIPSTWNKDYHMIDAEAFLDDDGTPYVYWGSGWGWKNGHCFVSKLNKEMNALVGEARDVTPPNYFEGPFTFKRQGKYYLSYSKGRTDQDSYEVHYAVSDSPMGPFTEPSPEAILSTDTGLGVVSPGHHAVLLYQNTYYILYHRRALPLDPKNVLRQVCMDRLDFKPDGTLAKVSPTHSGAVHLPPATLREGHRKYTKLKITASSSASPDCGPEKVIDDNYATHWTPATFDNRPWLNIDLGEMDRLDLIWLRLEYATKKYAFTVHVSDDRKDWTLVADYREHPASGSPVLVEAPPPCRYIHIEFYPQKGGAYPGLWEIGLQPQDRSAANGPGAAAP